MEKEEIKGIAEYLKELEEGLYEWDEGIISWQNELGTLHRTIEKLMKATFEAQPGVKTLLATLEKKARECRSCILERTGIAN